MDPRYNPGYTAQSRKLQSKRILIAQMCRELCDNSLYLSRALNFYFQLENKHAASWRISKHTSVLWIVWTSSRSWDPFRVRPEQRKDSRSVTFFESLVRISEDLSSCVLPFLLFRWDGVALFALSFVCGWVCIFCHPGSAACECWGFGGAGVRRKFPVVHTQFFGHNDVIFQFHFQTSVCNVFWERWASGFLSMLPRTIFIHVSFILRKSSWSGSGYSWRLLDIWYLQCTCKASPNLLFSTIVQLCSDLRECSSNTHQSMFVQLTIFSDSKSYAIFFFVLRIPGAFDGARALGSFRYLG